MTGSSIECSVSLTHDDLVMSNHRVHSISILPGVVFIDLILRILAAKEISPATVGLKRIRFFEPVATAELIDKDLRIEISLPDATGANGSVSVSSRTSGSSHDHVLNMRAELESCSDLEPAPLAIAALLADARRFADMPELYRRAREEGITHGPAMRCTGTLHSHGGGLLAELALEVPDSGFLMHPAALDATTIAAFGQAPEAFDDPFIPISIEEFRFQRPLPERFVLLAPEKERLAETGDLISASYQLYDLDGNFCASFERLACKRIRSPDLIKRLLDAPAEPVPAAAVAAAGHGDYRSLLTAWVAALIGVAPEAVNPELGFYTLGLDSRNLLDMAERLEREYSLPVYPTLLFEHSNINALSSHLQSTHGDLPRAAATSAAALDDAVPPMMPNGQDAEAEALLMRPGWLPDPRQRPNEQRDIGTVQVKPFMLAAADLEQLAAVLPSHCAIEPEPTFADPESEPKDRTTRLWLAFLPAELVDQGEALLLWANRLIKRIAAAPGAADLVLLDRTGSGQPALAGLAAYCACIRLETPRLNARLIQAETEDWPAAVLAEIERIGTTMPPTCGVIRYRGAKGEISGLINGPKLVEFSAGEPDWSQFSADDACLVSGGGGGIARHVCAWLNHHQPELSVVLLGRSAAGPDWLNQQGAKSARVTYQPCDVASDDDVARVLADLRGRGLRIRAVFHTAASAPEAIHLALTEADIAKALRAKCAGFSVLDAATRSDPLVWFVNFASLAPWCPNPGQSAYAFANAMLEQQSLRRAGEDRAPGKTICVAWPLWAEGGMQLDAGQRARASRETGMIPLPTGVALDLLGSALAGQEPVLTIAYGNRAQIAARLIGEATPQSVPSPVPAAIVRTVPDQLNPNDAIAIIGLAGRFPGAEDIAAFWDLLRGGRDMITPVPVERWAGCEETALAAVRGRFGGFLDDIARFDARHFHISRKEAEALDPQERLFLENSWTLLEAAGYPAASMKGADIGVFVGVMWNHYQLYGSGEVVAPPAMHASIANRVSYAFDFKGPSLALDTACSSTLTAFGAALDALRFGQCNMAIAGGVNLAVHPEKYRQLAAGKFLSEDGRCRSFGAGGTGYVPGEGVGAVLLKPLARALADGDDIWGVVAGFAARHSGQTGGFTVPSASAQAEVIRQAWRSGGVSPESLSYVEAHGTGTSLGDPIEIEGLAQALGPDRSAPLPIGSVKSNIGHLESAAGIAAIAKVLLMMRAGELVPSLHASQLNPRLPLAGTRIEVVQARSPWRPTKGHDRLRAGISSFGAGGANTHLVLDAGPARASVPAAPGEHYLVPLSAPDHRALQDYAQRLLLALEQHAGRPAGSAQVHPLLLEMTGLGADDILPGDSLAALGLQASEIRQLGAATGLDLTADSLAGEIPAAGPARGSDESGLLAAVAYQLQCRRSHLPARVALVADSLAGLIDQLRNLVDSAALPLPDSGGNLDDHGNDWVQGGTPDFVAHWQQPVPPRIDLPVPRLSRDHRFWPGQWQAAQNPAQQVKALSQSEPGAEAVRLEVSAHKETDMSDHAASDEIVRVEVEADGVALVSMNDPANHNMFTEVMLRDLERIFSELGNREDVRALVIAGTSRVFSLGGTPETLERLARKDMTFTSAPFLYEGLHACRVPVVAAVQGRAAGGGLAFALHADLVVLDRDGLYSANFVKFGFTPGLGATYLLERYFGPLLAQEMCLTGRDYRGSDLEQNGAQARFAPRDQVLETALQLARSIAQNPLEAVRALKQEYSKRATTGLAAAITGEVAMHDSVLGAGALDQVRSRTKVAAASLPASRSPAATVAEGPIESKGSNASPVSSGYASNSGHDLARITELLLEALQSTLYLERHEIDPAATFGEMGLDSLGAVEIVHAINDRFGCDLDSVLVYDFPTLERLAREVSRAIGPAAGSPESTIRAGQVAAGQAQSPVQEPADQPAPVPPAVPPTANSGAAKAADAAPSAANQPSRLPPIVLKQAATGNVDDRTPEPARLRLATPVPLTKPIQPVPITPAVSHQVAAAAAPARQADAGPSRPDALPDRFSESDIAIIGMSARYPGSNSVDAFWQRLIDADLQVQRNTDHRWGNAELWRPQDRANDGRWVGFVEGIDRFDAAFFGISPREAELMDPQQRVFLEQSWKALEHAGYAVSTEAELDCGVFVGTASGDYLPLLHARGVGSSGQVFLGNSCSVLAGRIAYFLNMRGPTVALDTACSSSLVAVHLAIQAIRAGDCSMALAGGIGLMVTSQMHTWNANSGMLSERGRCASFDGSADGFVLGEGAGIVVLKPLAQALADRDHIHAVIKASGINGDGRTNGITAPSAEAQFALQRRVHARAGVPIDSIGYVETHGAGTQLGDPIEAKALTQLMAARSAAAGPCGIGSIKSNLGHTTLAAGVAGLLKVTLALANRQIPASLHFEQLNDKIRLDPARLRIVHAPETWRPAQDGLCYAALNSFGVSGTNCHLVLSEGPDLVGGQAGLEDDAYLLPVSAKSPKALQASLQNLRDDLAAGASLADAAFTLAVGRTHFGQRAAIIAKDRDEALAEIARLLAAGPAPRSETAPNPEAPMPAWSVGLSRAELESLAAAYRSGAVIDFAAFCQDRAGRRIPLRGYPLESRRYWLPEQDERIEQSLAPEAAAAPSPPARRTLIEVVDPTLDWVTQHRVGGACWLPGAAVLSWMLGRLGQEANGLSDVEWLTPAAITSRMEVYAVPDSRLPGHFTFGAGESKPWSRAALCHAPAPPPLPFADFRSAFEGLPQGLGKAAFYERFSRSGIDYGPGYRLIAEARFDAVRAIALLEEGAGDSPQLYDAMLQTVACLMPEGERQVPSRIGQVWRYGPVGSTAVVVAERTQGAGFAVRGYDRHGTATLAILGFELAPVPANPPASALRALAYRQIWAPAPDIRWPAGHAGPANGRTVITLAELSAAEGLARVQGQSDIWLDCRGADDGDPEAVLSGLQAGLVRLLECAAPGGTISLITAGAAQVRPDEPVRPVQAAIQAMARAAVAEHRQLTYCWIDLETASGIAVMGASQAMPAMAPRAGMYALREGSWHEPVLVPLAGPEAAVPPVEPGKHYLIVGGAGGLGFVLSQALAKAGAKLSWIGRRQPDAATKAKLAVIKQKGAEIRYAAADIADPVALGQAIRQLRAELGPISGAYHSALDLHDAALADCTPADLHRVLRPKVAGLKVLAAALEGEPISHLVLFSSVASQMRAPGQANYAAASAFMDSYACDLRQRLGTPVTVVNWGYWGTVGIVSDDHHVQAMAAAGVGSIEPDEGFAWLWHQLALRLPDLTVLKADPARLAEFGLRLAEPALAASVQSARPSVDPVAPVQGGQAEDASPATLSDSAQAMGGATAAPRQSPLAYVTDVFARILKSGVDELDLDATFETYGVDSLIAMDVVRQLKRDLGELPATLLYERLTIREVSRHLEQVKAAELAQLLSPPVAAAAPVELESALASAAPALGGAPSSAVSMAMTAAAGPAIHSDPVPVAGQQYAHPGAVPTGHELKPRMAAESQAEEIAVIGLAGRFPGASDLDGFWDNLRAGVRSISAAPAERGDWQRLLSERRERNRAYNIEGGFLDQVDRFDAAFFGILASDAVAIDPQERLFLELCWQLLEQAGHNGADSRQAQTGVFVGSMYGSYGQIAAAAGWHADRYDLGHSPMWSIANRISYQFNFSGPSLCVDTACSSSLTAVHLACAALRRGECREAIAGGINLILHPAHHVALSGMQMLGTGAACRTFDAAADGIVPGEGLGAVLLRPLAEAQAAGDEILAVISGSMINAGGKTGGYTVPNPAAQAEVISRALAAAETPREAVGCMEVHGTGTALGDPIEIAALNQVFGQSGDGPIWAGSVKANIGHLEGAAGIAGLTKAILQLQHREIAPCAGLERLNDKIEFDGRVRPATKLTTWQPPASGLRTCGVSSFGAGGANAHVVLREYQPVLAGPSAGAAAAGEQVFLLSAATPAQLARYAGRIASWLGKNAGVDLARLCHTSQIGRRALAVRAACHAETIAGLQEQLSALAAGAAAPGCFTSDSSGSSDFLQGEIGASLTQALLGARKRAELARLWAAGLPVDWRLLWDHAPARIAYPAVPFAGPKLWFQAPEPRTAAADELAAPAAASWLVELAGDHRIAGQAILPGSALIALATNHARAGGAAAIGDFRWLRPVPADQLHGLTVTTRPQGRWAVLAEGDAREIATFAVLQVATPVDSQDSNPDIAEVLKVTPGADFYAELAQGNYHYGPSLRLIDQISQSRARAEAGLAACPAGEGALAAVLDAAMQTVVPLCSEPALPAGFAEWHWIRPAESVRRVIARALPDKGHFNLALYDADGGLAGIVRDFRVAAAPQPPAGRAAEIVYLAPAESASERPRLATAPAETALFYQGTMLSPLLEAAARASGMRLIDAAQEPSAAGAGTAVIAFDAISDPARQMPARIGAMFEAVNCLRGQRKDGRVRCLVIAADTGAADRALAATAKTLALENPWLEIVHVAIESTEFLADALRELLVAGACADEVVLRPSGRFLRQMAAIGPEPAKRPSLVTEGFYLITGGAGGLGRHFAEHLVGFAPVTVALLGRSAPSAELAAWLSQAEARGHRIAYRAADVADQSALRHAIAALADEFGPLRGVIHAVGVQLDGLARSQSEQQINAVLAPKVAGTLALDRCLAAHDPDFVVLCSSLSGELGSIGQAAYAAANRFLIHFAEEREARRRAGLCSGVTTAVAWPLWREGGMTVDPATERLFAERHGMAPLATADGLAALDLALTGTLTSFAVLQPSPAKAVPSAPSPVAGPEAAQAAPSARPGTFDEAALLARIADLAAEFLMVPSAEVELDRPLLEIGFDSISLTDLVNRINAEFGLDILPSVLFECPTFQDVAAYLGQNHGDALALHWLRQNGDAPAPSEAAPPAPSPAAMATAMSELDVAGQGTTASLGAEPIAVIGMAGRFAGASSVRALWRMLESGEDFLRTVGPDRPDLAGDALTATMRAGLLDGIEQFDCGLFGISPREAALMDPQQRLFLETTYQAIQDAGYARCQLAGMDVGVFAGVSTSDYDTLLTQAGVADDPHVATGISHAVLANRVSHVFNWTGPSVIVDTACSSSLVALSQAVAALRQNECSLACCGGVNAILAPGLFHAFDRSGMLSKDFRCKTFDAAADGYVRGEGVGVVVLKRLADALRDGDAVHAVIRGVAVNHVGKSASLTAPNPAAQAAVIRKAIAAAAVDPATISFIETHGTGTQLGDLVEVEGLKAAFADSHAPGRPFQPIRLGAIKTAIGHLEAAAGVAGLIKVVLCLEHNRLVANRNFTAHNLALRLAESPFQLINESVRWSALSTDLRRAGISSFGFGGTNAHAIIESYAVTPAGTATVHPVAIPLAAPGPDLLAAYAHDLAEAIREGEMTLPQIAQTLRRGRDQSQERRILVCATRDDLLGQLELLAQGRLTHPDSSGPDLPLDEADAAAAWLDGRPVRWPDIAARVCSLPPAPFARKAYWFEPRAAELPATSGSTDRTAPLRKSGQIVLEPVSDDLPPTPLADRGPTQVRAPVEVPPSSATPAAAMASDGLVPDLVSRLSELLMIPPAEIAIDACFTDLGLDSILRMDLARGLNADLELELTGTDLYEHDTVQKLAVFIGQHRAPTPQAGLAENARAPIVAEQSEAVSGIAAGAVAAPADGLRVAAIVRDRCGIDVLPGQDFTAAGLSSFDMLRTIAELEQSFGPLPKTIMFDAPSPVALEALLAERFPDAAVSGQGQPRAETVPVAGIEAAIQRLASGAIVAPKRLLKDNAELTQTVAQIDAAHAKEQGLPGRDIAPYVFISADGDGYLHFAQRDRVLVSWSSCVAPDRFVGLAAQWADWATSQGLIPNLLAMEPVAQMNGLRFRTTAFGTVQRIPELAEFSLRGKRMARLRDKLNAFSRHGPGEVREYKVGTNPETDLRIVTLIDEWAGRKAMINPYVTRVRQEIGNGVLADHHRMFLCAQNGIDLVAIIVTKIVSENGYLLDLEFFADAMPDGGVDFTIVRILETLQAEGVAMFSFGATLGVKLFESPDPHPAVEAALDDLRRAGIFSGEGNLRFKNKYRPEALPIYLCQPETLTAADLSTVLLAITSPAVELDEPDEAPARPRRQQLAAELATQAAAQQPQVQDAADAAAQAQRRDVLRQAGWNVLAVTPDEPLFDLVTDSWAERRDPFIGERKAAIANLAAPAQSDAPLLPQDLLLAMPSGKAAEAALLQALVRGNRKVILQNNLFPSWTYHSLDLGLQPRLFASDPATGAIDPAAMAGLFARHAGDAALCCLELAPNALGGLALPLEVLTLARRLASEHGVPLVFDATRALGHASVLADACGEDAAGLFSRICGLADAVTLSLSKEYGLDFGGLVATSDPGLKRALQTRIGDRGHEVGQAGRAQIAAAVADQFWPLAMAGARARQVERLAEEFRAAGVPVKAAGVHAVLIDAEALLPGRASAVASVLAWLYLKTGIKAAPHLASGVAELRSAIRLAIPAGLPEAEFGRLLQAVRCGLTGGIEIEELLRIDGAAAGDGPVTYVPHDELPDDIAADLKAGPRPTAADGNWSVISRWQPHARRRMLQVAGTEVEVFEAGAGEPIILLHPFNVGAGFFAPQFRDLAQDHRVIVLHAPGAGATEAIADLSFEGLSRQVIDTADALGIVGRFQLAGASFGGLTALSTALRYPERISRLVLLGSSYKVGNRKGEINRLATVVDQDCAALELAGKCGQIARAELAEILGQCETMDPKTGLRYLDVFAARPNLLEAARGLGVPALLIHGAHDTVIALDIARELAGAIPEAQLEVLDDAGHFPSLTSHAAVNRLFKRAPGRSGHTTSRGDAL